MRSGGEQPCRSPRAILVILVAGIGDWVMATPAIRSLSRRYPEAAIHLLTSTEAAAIARRNPRLERVWAFPIRELRRHRKALWTVFKLIRDLRKTRFDIAVNFYPVCMRSGAVKMALLFRLLRARMKLSQGPWPLCAALTRRIDDRVFAGKHMTESMNAVAGLLGARDDREGPELVCAPAAKFDEMIRPEDGRSPVVAVHPGADSPSRRWRPERFARVADELVERCGARVIVLGGPSDEALAASVVAAMHSRALNLCGQVRLDELPYVLSRCDLLLANDSGPMHLAAAAQTPVVAIFGPGYPSVFGPYGPPARIRVIQKSLNCMPCRNPGCRAPACQDSITPAEVSAAGLDLLRAAGHGPREPHCG
jgi:heptosyltransferase-2